MVSLADKHIDEALKPYGVLATTDLRARIREYVELLLKWNRTVSLTTVTDVDEVLSFHFGESLFALPMLPVEKSRLADVGSGAGFPGIPLAMARPALQVTLIEPNVKKFSFLSEVVRNLDISNAVPFRGRMAEFQHEKEPLDVVTARALGQFDKLIRWSQHQLGPSGSLFLWLGQEDATKLSADPRFRWGTQVKIPGAERRAILVGSPQLNI